MAPNIEVHIITLAPPHFVERRVVTPLAARAKIKVKSSMARSPSVENLLQPFVGPIIYYLQ